MSWAIGSPLVSNAAILESNRLQTSKSAPTGAGRGAHRLRVTCDCRDVLEALERIVWSLSVEK